MFSGFLPPEANYSKLPHQLIDALSSIEDVSELKVVLYILRHTWGYGDNDKNISIDEFMLGRKKRDGQRIDRGTGIKSRTTVVKALRQAQEHGFIVLNKHRTKAGWVICYRLRNDGEANSTPELDDDKHYAESSHWTTPVQSLDHPSPVTGLCITRIEDENATKQGESEASHSLKETIERNLSKPGLRPGLPLDNNQPPNSGIDSHLVVDLESKKQKRFYCQVCGANQEVNFSTSVCGGCGTAVEFRLNGVAVSKHYRPRTPGALALVKITAPLHPAYRFVEFHSEAERKEWEDAEAKIGADEIINWVKWALFDIKSGKPIPRSRIIHSVASAVRTKGVRGVVESGHQQPTKISPEKEAALMREGEIGYQMWKDDAE